MALITSEPKALDGNLIRRRQWINDWLNTKARGSSSRSKRAARRRPDVFAGNVEIGVAEKEALPRSRAAPTSRSSWMGRFQACRF
jgi:hypothetical protein